ncbi:unnamed protein product [Moneuplotes crassus]|uniref:Uncharacterized protein n=1 Tax=Euplotes crassus TaxID=5936 RepID=A0AAD1XR22_EUPCR|nr:unnamed protein product [Moneuplotes crassus]
MRTRIPHQKLTNSVSRPLSPVFPEALSPPNHHQAPSSLQNPSKSPSNSSKPTMPKPSSRRRTIQKTQRSQKPKRSRRKKSGIKQKKQPKRQIKGLEIQLKVPSWLGLEIRKCDKRKEGKVYTMVLAKKKGPKIDTETHSLKCQMKESTKSIEVSLRKIDEIRRKPLQNITNNEYPVLKDTRQKEKFNKHANFDKSAKALKCKTDNKEQELVDFMNILLEEPSLFKGRDKSKHKPIKIEDSILLEGQVLYSTKWTHPLKDLPMFTSLVTEKSLKKNMKKRELKELVKRYVEGVDG